MPVSYSWGKKYWKQAGGEANLNQSCQKTTPPLLQQVPGCGSFIYIPPLVFQEVREHFTEQNKDFIVMYCSRKVIHIRGVEAPGSKSQFFFQLLLKDTSTVSDTLIALKMKCVISTSQDALGGYQITLLSQTDTLVSFIVFISLHRELIPHPSPWRQIWPLKVMCLFS